ncbi:MAG: hypothetical protein HOQ07_13745, partial [Sinomonas sp.]|nr:hypothetical protein [Sinomonas sp.]
MPSRLAASPRRPGGSPGASTRSRRAQWRGEPSSCSGGLVLPWTDRDGASGGAYSRGLSDHEVLDEARLTAELEKLPDWRHRAGGLATVYKLPSSAAALAFIAAVGEIAEELVHHPD